jgi:sporulation protein YlmC with PRC-barrel domain
MYLKVITAAAIGALVSTAAIAQTPSSSNPSPKSAQSTSNAPATASTKGEWQASKLIRMNVYNGQNEKIGDIKELMLDKTGKIDVVAIAVGGFLGMGEHDVAVKFDQLKWVNEPVSSTTSSNTTNSNSSRAATTGSAQTQNTQNRNYPDHAVLDATKDQLKSMPQFDYNK